MNFVALMWNMLKVLLKLFLFKYVMLSTTTTKPIERLLTVMVIRNFSQMWRSCLVINVERSSSSFIVFHPAPSCQSINLIHFHLHWPSVFFWQNKQWRQCYFHKATWSYREYCSRLEGLIWSWFDVVTSCQGFRNQRFRRNATAFRHYSLFCLSSVWLLHCVCGQTVQDRPIVCIKVE